MFADLALARRVERAVATLSADMARPSAVEPAGAGYAICYGGYLSKVIGIGLDSTHDVDALDGVERRSAECGAAVRAEVCTLAHPAVFAALRARGYVFHAVEHVLGLPLPPPPEARAVADGLRVDAVERDDLRRVAHWVSLMVRGFTDPEVTETGVTGDVFPPAVLQKTFTKYWAVDGFRGYLASVDGQSVGGASLRTADGIALYCGATTLPAFRRRGVQAALVRRRLGDAAAAGCDLAVSGAAPGSPSQRSAMRQGFSVLYARAIMIKPAPATAWRGRRSWRTRALSRIGLGGARRPRA